MSHTMKIDAARPRDNYPIVVSREFLARLGHAYRIKARMRATHPEAKVNLMLQGYEANVYFWANWPSELKVDRIIGVSSSFQEITN